MQVFYVVLAFTCVCGRTNHHRHSVGNSESSRTLRYTAAFMVPGCLGARMKRQALNTSDDVTDVDTTVTVIDPEQIITSSPLTTLTESPLEKRIMGLNIGLYFVLEDLRKKLTLQGSVPTELIIKVLVLSSKIEEVGGDVVSVNRSLMRVLPDILPVSFRNSTCSP